MENISLPSKITVEPGSKDNKNESIISIQPCHPGYGTTLGNALRRVLMSSLPGAAVTAFKIKGASHEYSAISGVLEDGIEITLNLKQLRFKIHSDQPVHLELKAKGEKQVTAGDITPNSDVEIVDPDAVIATLTEKSAELDMTIVVSSGRGFVTTEARENEPQEVGMIAIDSVFTPVQNVGFRVENVRVGQMTNFENLILSVETDGSITGEEALSQASKLLIDHFNFISENSTGTALPQADAEEKVEEVEEIEPTESDEQPQLGKPADEMSVEETKQPDESGTDKPQEEAEVEEKVEEKKEEKPKRKKRVSKAKDKDKDKDKDTD